MTSSKTSNEPTGKPYEPSGTSAQSMGLDSSPTHKPEGRSAPNTTSMSNNDDWASRAACKGVDPNLFYPDRGEDVSVALELCTHCPVRAECQAWGLRHENHGIWGGLSNRKRRKIRSALGISYEDPGGIGAGRFTR